METETQLVKRFYQKKAASLANNADKEDMNVTQDSAKLASSTKSGSSATSELRLPDYLLDFGHVILGDVKTHVLCATNIGYHPISFTIDDARLKGTGMQFYAILLPIQTASYGNFVHLFVDGFYSEEEQDF